MSTAFDVDPRSMKHVFGHTASLIHIRRALASDYCAAAVRAAEQLKFKPYEKTEDSVDFDPVLKFGPGLFDYHESQDFDAYFCESERAFHVGAEAFRKAHVVNPLTVVLDTCAATLSPEVFDKRRPFGRDDPTSSMLRMILSLDSALTRLIDRWGTPIPHYLQQCSAPRGRDHPIPAGHCTLLDLYL